MKGTAGFASALPVLLVCCGCLLEYDNCSIVFSVDGKAQCANVSISADKVRLPEDPTGIIKDPKKHYETLTEPEMGVIPKTLAVAFGCKKNSCKFPKFEQLPGTASFTGSGAPFVRSIMVAFDSWDYNISKTGRQYSFAFVPTKISAEIDKTPWDTFRLRTECKVVSHNADSVEKETGELVWNVNRGSRTENVSFTIEAKEPVYSGAP